MERLEENEQKFAEMDQVLFFYKFGKIKRLKFGFLIVNIQKRIQKLNMFVIYV